MEPEHLFVLAFNGKREVYVKFTQDVHSKVIDRLIDAGYRIIWRCAEWDYNQKLRNGAKCYYVDKKANFRP